MSSEDQASPQPREREEPEPRKHNYRVTLQADHDRVVNHPPRPSISLLDADWALDPLEDMAWMRANAPAYWDAETGIWGIARHADILRMEADWETFSSGQGSRPGSNVPSMIDSDPPEHTRRRRIVSSGFTPRRVRAHEAFLRATVDSLIDDVIDNGRCDFVADIATWVPLRMIAKLMGLPVEDERKLIHWSDLFAAGDADLQRQVETAVLEYAGYIVEQMATRTDPAAEDLISLLIHTEGDPLSTEDLIYETMLILVGGDETTRHALSGGLEQLLGHPDQLQRLRADRSLLPGAIEEMLRWTTPVRNMNRTATRDVEVGGEQIKAGDRMLLLYQSGNRDETVFDDPEVFDIERSPNPHVAFGGNGRHFCLGAQLARLELTVVFEQLLDRLPNLRLQDPTRPCPERRGVFVIGLETLPITY